MIPYHQDPKHAAPLYEAPRCQHIGMNGRRCGSPALRGRRLCFFHRRIRRPAKHEDYMLPFIEDATSLQYALMQVMRSIRSAAADLKACGLLLYSLQIACANLKNFMAERPRPEIAEGEQPQAELLHAEPRQPKPGSGQKEKKVDNQNADEPSLAELLLGLLAKGEHGDPNEPPPRIRNREDYYAAVEQRQRCTPALPQETAPSGTQRSQ